MDKTKDKSKKKKNKGKKIFITDENFCFRNYSRRIDKRLLMDYTPGEHNLIIDFIESIYPTLNIKSPKINTVFKKEALNNIITNSLVCIQEGKILAFPRGKAVYKNNSSYGLDHFTYTNMVGGADALIEADYLNKTNGFWDKETKKGEVSRVNPTPKLIDELNCNALYPIAKSVVDDEDELCRIHFVFGKKLSRKKLKNPIVLKDADKNEIMCPLNKKVLLMKKFLEKYNSFVEENLVSVPSFLILPPTYYTVSPDTQNTSGVVAEYTAGGSITPLLGKREVKLLNYIKLDCWLYRVFNYGRFDRGGRFYGANYQALSDEVRAKMLINGNQVVEVDFSALHARMIYNELGMDYRGDPYEDVCPVKELRTPIKKMMQIAINAENEREAIYAFEKWLLENIEMADAVYGNGLDGKELMNLIRRTHRRIEKYFNSGKGIELQFRDSSIAERVMKHFLRKRIVCLCVHDSFIVEREYQDELIEMMRKEYRREMGFDCKLKVDGNEV